MIALHRARTASSATDQAQHPVKPVCLFEKTAALHLITNTFGFIGFSAGVSPNRRAFKYKLTRSTVENSLECLVDEGVTSYRVWKTSCKSSKAFLKSRLNCPVSVNPVRLCLAVNYRMSKKFGLKSAEKIIKSYA